MSRRTLLDLLGTEKLPQKTEQRFINYCINDQARPALLKVLRAVGLSAQADSAEASPELADVVEHVRDAAQAARESGLPVMQMGAVQGVSTEIEQLFIAADPAHGDPAGVSFHAARLYSWAAWADSHFQTGALKASAENVAYGNQLKILINLLNPQADL